MRFYLRSKSLLIPLSMILVFVTLGNPQAIAKKPECTGAEMALLYNLKEMSFTEEVLMQDDSNRIDFLASRYSDFISAGNTSSPDAVSLKNQIDALKSKLSNSKRQIASLDAQSKKVLTKCKETTVEKLQASKNRKICTSNEKKAINSVIASFRSVQDKKRNWDGKKRVAEAWMNDLAKPSSIRATAMSDFRTYSRYYEIEEVKESFVVSQFEFINAGCKNSGLYLPKVYAPPTPTPTPQPDPSTGVYLIDWRFNYNSSQGGFTSEQAPDESVKIQCKDGNRTKTKWDFPIGLNLEGAKLLVTGSREKNWVFNDSYSAFTLSSNRVKDFLVPVERIDVFGTAWGYQYQDWSMDDYKMYDIIGKSIGFSADGSICGLTTEPLSNLKQTLASDIQTAALILLIKTDKNPGRNWPLGDQIAILVGSFKILSVAEKAEADKAFAERAAAAEKAAAEKAAAEKAAAEKAAAEKAAAEKAARECLPVNCPSVGSIGPGGGIVFYDAGSYQSWGRYLEVAPKDWSGKADPNAEWCNVIDVLLSDSISDLILKAKIGDEIGKGKANTNMMLAGCNSGAAVLANSYKGGGKSDWYLPSIDELTELFNRSKEFLPDYYWSSSEACCWTTSTRKTPGAWTIDFTPRTYGLDQYRSLFTKGIVYPNGDRDIPVARVRPIRAF